MSRYYGSSIRPESLGLPLCGEIALAYRCNNKCRHCWVCLPQTSDAKTQEMSFDEVVGIADQARSLAEALGNGWKLGVSWLRLNAYGSKDRNREIIRQRIHPRRMVDINPPSPSANTGSVVPVPDNCAYSDLLLESCTATDAFRIDPYGSVSFCEFIMDPALRYDLRKGNFRDYWVRFRPFIAGAVRGDTDYSTNCGARELSDTCYWCPALACLENGRYAARVAASHAEETTLSL